MPASVLDPATLAAHRETLIAYARSLLNVALAGKLDLSGVVQQTLLEAALSSPPEDPAGVGYWLRALLKRNYLDEVKRLTADRRDVGREVALSTDDHASSSPSPSRQAAHAEDLVALAEVLVTLPEPQQVVIRHRYLDEMSLEEIAIRVGKTKQAVAGLLRRGVKGLRSQLRLLKDI